MIEDKKHIHISECADSSHDHLDCSVCHQCGKVHSIFFIKEHHCLEETLCDKKQNLQEQLFQNFFFTRAPPLLID
tara:strand:+ start:450 stop:674 length:225 start_codon:yes stop_codon:yes gene_type:complete